MPTLEFPKVREMRWTVADYDRMQEQGFFRNRRVELIDGRIIQMSAQLEPHVAATSLAGKAMERAFGGEFWVRRQNPLRLGNRWKPEPDVAVVRGTENDYIDIGNPRTALLVVEVSDSTLKYDRGRKASTYARHGIADYWIVNLVDRQVEVHRQPIRDPAHQFKYRYEQVEIFSTDRSVRPLALNVEIQVANLLPRIGVRHATP